MDPDSFRAMIGRITADIQGRAIDESLMAELNEQYPAGGGAVAAIEAACQQGIAEGWMCKHEAGGIRYGRVVKPGTDTHGFSVDVVHMNDVVGPYHRHPNGEIDLIMPISAGAKFDGHGAGWLVYGPDTAHHPTVTGGEALVLYLLPDGEIAFERPPRD